MMKLMRAFCDRDFGAALFVPELQQSLVEL
jgi:hypothetical protein